MLLTSLILGQKFECDHQTKFLSCCISLFIFYQKEIKFVPIKSHSPLQNNQNHVHFSLQIGSMIFNSVVEVKTLFLPARTPQSKSGMLTKAFVCQHYELIKIMSKHWRMPKIENR
jgi:hypothetical protein